jgi:similar to stage IV sporulation protein
MDGKITFSIDFHDSKKLFAISRNMCYNITRVKYYGRVSAVKKMLENIGFSLCFACFFVLCILFDGWVSAIEYKGDGEYLKPQIQKVFLQEGIKTGCFFNKDEKNLAQKILLSSDKISFVTVTKSGRTLYVEAYMKTESPKVMDTKKQSIISTVNGRVSKINLLSGSAMVAVGDYVKKGDVLIDGKYEKDGEVFNLYALGEVEVIAEYVFSYKSFAKGEKYKKRAIALAEYNLGEENVIESKVKEKIQAKEVYYEVTLYYLVTVG